MGRWWRRTALWVDEADMNILKQHSTGVAHCPSSNTKLASGVCAVTRMLQLGLKVGLGTDGFAGSNDTADLIQEMNLAAKLQKVTAMDPRVLPAEQVFAMATIGGAQVLGLDKQIGSLEVGKRADVIAISIGHPNAVPLYNLYSQLVYAAKAPDVEDVFINGRQIVSARHMLTLNEQDIDRQAQIYRIRIAASVK